MQWIQARFGIAELVKQFLQDRPLLWGKPQVRKHWLLLVRSQAKALATTIPAMFIIIYKLRANVSENSLIFLCLP